MPTITNAEVDAFVALIPPPWFGPGTRVTDVESPQLNNDDYFFISVPHGYGGVSQVYLTYDNLQAPDEYRPVVFAAVIDDWAAAYPAPFGPLTRETATADLPIYDGAFKENLTLKLAAPYNTEFFASYEQISQPLLLTRLVTLAAGIQSRVAELRADIANLHSAANALTAPYTVAEYNNLVELYTKLSMKYGHLARL